jgi:hypothetical protein
MSGPKKDLCLDCRSAAANEVIEARMNTLAETALGLMLGTYMPPGKEQHPELAAECAAKFIILFSVACNITPGQLLEFADSMLESVTSRCLKDGVDLQKAIKEVFAEHIKTRPAPPEGQ